MSRETEHGVAAANATESVRGEMPAHIIGISAEMREQRADQGWSTQDTWSFDAYLAGVIAGGVRELASREIAYPGNLSVEEWDKILAEIVKGFDWYAKGGAFDLKPSKKKRKQFDKSFALLHEWFGALWD